MSIKELPRGLRSMTGFGQSQRRVQGVLVSVELKSVNHRFLDVSFKMPRSYQVFEAETRQILERYFLRGHVDVFVGRVVEQHTTGAVQFDKPLLRELYRLEAEALAEFGVLQGLSAGAEAELKARMLADLFRRQDVCGLEEEMVSAEAERIALGEAIEEAAKAVLKTREGEGARLRGDFNQRLATLQTLRGEISKRAGELSKSIRARLLERVKKLSPEVVVDEARVAAEVVLLADRSDITEELVRLEAHLQSFTDALAKEPRGKRFDFLLQEIHREFNTVGSKVQEGDIQKVVIEAKIEIEKIREQVQNIE